MTAATNGVPSPPADEASAPPRAWTFPSEAFPAWPTVSLDAPPSWEPVAAPGAVMALRAVEPAPTGFRSNVVVTVTRWGNGHSLARCVVDLEARIARLPQPREVTAREVRVAEHVGHLRELAFAHPQAGAVHQAHLLVILDRGRVRDLVHVTGSCADDQPGELDDVRAILASVSARAV